MNIAFVFPGQGSQFVGMGKDLFDNFPQAKLVFEEVDDALNQKLSKIIFEGPAEELTLTSNTQPALMAVSLATYLVMHNECGIDISKAKFLAGHSLGEYSALAVANVLPIADTARLLRTRGQAMQEAVPVGDGAMAAVLGLEIDEVQDITHKHKCDIANDNCPGQVVISGKKQNVEHAVAEVTASGKKAVLLQVSAPFHSNLMLNAEKVMAEALAKTSFNVPASPIVTNITANAVTDPAELKSLLVKQVCGMVRWRESINYMLEQGIDTIVEIGAGKVLTGLNKRISKDIKGISIQNVDDMKATQF
jgi:[acyl-carrier-protein] S-malonyltransferase